MNKKWTGRFAPSPSGVLHFGSLVAALASYVIAKQKQGKWLLRIEDLDPPREIAGATENILSTLEAFGFEWDGEVVYQSQRANYYYEFLAKLKDKGVSYSCDCSRKLLRKRNKGIYDSFCRDRSEKNIGQEHAIRVKFNDSYSEFYDEIFGNISFKSEEDLQDFIVYRRDGLFAYQLAVVVDDIEQQVNHVVRGADILDSTPRQNFLYDCFNHQPPKYFHLPLAVNQTGAKLSKRSFSPSVDPQSASDWLVKALQHLGQKVGPDLSQGTPEEVLAWGVEHWDIDCVGTQVKVY